MKKLFFIKLFYILSLAIFYLSSTQLNMIYAQTNTVCDNGGFEQDFLYYSGYLSTFRQGSNTCRPIDSLSNTITYSIAALPTEKRIEIVTSGTDTLVGIQRTRFGSKALRLNYKYGHDSTFICDGSYGVDKVVKQFTVTEETRNFTVWYAVVLENPAGHKNTQPFFNMNCDLAPNDELCLDADFLNCIGTYSEPTCNFSDTIDVLNWACHRFVIPKSEIGNIATLEIILADCGESKHFGYAYIDGICEECTGSVLGMATLDTINYYSCLSDSAEICGSYDPLDVCNENWYLKDLTVPGYEIKSLVIDTANQTFCFKFPLSNFGPNDDCLDVYVAAIFTNDIFDLPPLLSNPIDVCKTEYKEYSRTFLVSSCYDNTPVGGIADDNISDDYYYVYVDLKHTNGEPWTIDRTLDDPYPGENATHEIKTGVGDQNIVLGPFRIQEGSWKLSIIFEDCTYDEDIVPPFYCSGASDFYQTTISDVECVTNPHTWSFKIEVPGTGTFNIQGPGIPGGSVNLSKGMQHTIPNLPFVLDCYEYVLTILTQSTKFTICPPKPCSSSCYIEVYEKGFTCQKVNNVVTYFVELEASGPSGNTLCYLIDVTPPAQSLPNPQVLGPFSQDTKITVYLCTNSDCVTGCANPGCYKTIYIPLPDCNQIYGLKLDNIETEDKVLNELKVYPNPVSSDEIMLHSTMTETKFEILDAIGNQVLKDEFIGDEYKIHLESPSGLYLLRYKNSKGVLSIIKIIKL